MSMISPESFIDKLQNKSYKALTKERDRLIKEIQNFEKNEKAIMLQQKECPVFPSPDTVYWWNIQALVLLCNLMLEKLNDIRINLM